MDGNGIKHHQAGFADEQVIDVAGRRTFDLARTAVDIARERGVADGIVACDAAMRMGMPREALRRTIEQMRYWPGSRDAARCVSLADPGAENPHESLGRHLVIEAGIGVPETRFPVRTTDGTKWCDLRVGNHVIETDGRVKYRSVSEDGVATRSADDVAWQERKRERLVRDRGLVVTRIYWEDYRGRRRASAIARLRADHADAVARYGDVVPPILVHEAMAIRATERRRRHGGATTFSAL